MAPAMSTCSDKMVYTGWILFIKNQRTLLIFLSSHGMHQMNLVDRAVHLIPANPAVDWPIDIRLTQAGSLPSPVKSG